MQILKEFACLVRKWWTIDRVRAAPQEGRLLSLQVGQAAEICGRLFDITARHDSVGHVVVVEYGLYSAAGAARLTVQMSQCGRAVGRLTDADGCVTHCDDDWVVVIASRGVWSSHQRLRQHSLHDVDGEQSDFASCSSSFADS